MEALDCEELIEERIKMIENDENVSNFFESANIEVDLSDKISYEKVYENRKKLRELNKWKKIKLLNRFRLNYFKFNMNFGSNLINFLNIEKQKNFSCFNVDDTAIYKNLEHRVSEFEYMIKKFNVPTRKVVVMNNKNFLLDKKFRLDLEKLKKPKDIFHPFNLRLGFAFPDKYLLQYDCGKLQTLDKLLRDLKVGGHRALIFTQMTKMLDGSTQVQQRQILMDRFNNDKRILCFILSTRSGGVGMNLIGADSVIFYDSDWNPAMDAQAQDRAHRIGQTRDVHIYRFITSHTIEENMLKKANKKRVLDNIVIQEGEFNTDFFRKMHWKDWLGEEDDEEAGDDNVESENIGSIKNLEEALAMAEDQEDVVAMKNARKELNIIDLEDFKENEEGSFGSQQKQLQESNNPENSEDEKESHGVEKYMFKLVLNDWGFDEEIKLKEFFI
ncbi:swr1 complex component [Clydaea vesicula]|uniref:Swr1 complex component n=1 Tax=Clydaea vesicula TaxID=447962 RepID=A0AAD5XW08_9FUNG|nr:swr1 complex component [Clydaea vesicula]